MGFGVRGLFSGLGLRGIRVYEFKVYGFVMKGLLNPLFFDNMKYMVEVTRFED